MNSTSEIADELLAHFPSDLAEYSEIRYAGGQFTLDVDICSALFEYTLELARCRRWDTVTLPSLVAGVRVDTTILLGPDSQIWCSPVSIAFVDIADAATVRDLRERIESLHPRAVEVAYGDSLTRSVNDFDLEFGY